VEQVSHDLVLDSELKLSDVSQLPPLLIKLSLFLVPLPRYLSFLLDQLLLSVQKLVPLGC